MIGEGDKRGFSVEVWRVGGVKKINIE